MRRQRELEGVSTARHFRRRARLWGWQVLHDRRWSLLLALPAFLLAFLPVDIGPEALRESSFLEALWQVQAAALALSLAVVIFIFEAVYSARPRPSMRELAEDVRLPAIFYAGLFGLGLTGMVLLGFGTDAPGGWAALWCVIWAGLSGTGLIALFVAMLREIEPDLLYRRWLRRLTRQVELVIEAEIVERIAANLLKDVCERAGVEFIPVFGGAAAPHLEPIAAGSAGVVRDIDLRRIARAGQLSSDLGTASDHGGEQPTLLVYIGAPVAEGSTLMRVGGEIARRVRMRAAFEIDRRDPDAALNERRAVVQVRIAGEECVVFAPRGWRLAQTLELEAAERLGGTEAPPAWLPQEVRDSFLGTADAASVFDAVQAQLEGIAVVALARFARWHQWRIGGVSDVHVSLTEYDEESALALVLENGKHCFEPTCGRALRSAPARCASRFCSKFTNQFAIEVLDNNAACWLRVPNDLA